MEQSTNINTAAQARRLAVEYRAIGGLKPDPGNARTHPRRQVERIAASIREFGFSNPILIDPDGIIIAGHGRLLAARKLGMIEVPAIELAGLTEAKRRALCLADNKIALGAGWDLDILKAELAGIAAIDLDFDLGLTGFSSGELDVLLNPSGAEDEEALPPLPDQPRTRKGDIWILGEHRIGCGDPRDQDLLRRVVGGGVGGGVDAAFLAPAEEGEPPGEAPGRFLADAMAAAASVSRDGAVHFICADWRDVDELSSAARGIYGELLGLCVWTGKEARPGALYRSSHMLVFVYRVGEAGAFKAAGRGGKGRGRSNLWNHVRAGQAGGGDRSGGGPAEGSASRRAALPVALVADAMEDVTRRGDTMLDSFLGCGATLIAAEGGGRRLRGIEADPAHVDVAVDRWTAMTGGAPRIERRGPAA